MAVQGRHPWFYKKMVRKPEGVVPAGSAVRVRDSRGRKVGVGFYNPRTDLTLRMMSRDFEADPEKLLLNRLGEAAAYRRKVLRLEDVTDGYRVVHAEGDGLPALILDRLGDALVAQVGALCTQKHIEAIGERLLRVYPKKKLLLTVDAQARKREGLDAVPPPARVDTVVTEHEIRYAIAAGRGHKTGFFADQRDNRQLLRRLAAGRRVLDLCCNSGGFALNAAFGGADEVVAADLDESMAAETRANAKTNRLQVRAEHGDAFDVLRETKPGRFDLIVLDPPKWAADRHQLEAATARYLDLNRLGLTALRPGGILATFSCSGSLPDQQFLRIVRDAATQARRDLRILHRGGAGPDHPIAVECPETGYLKALFLEVRA
ncbi:MAG: class I SAM-dependent rRNA methyltransferase [Planctomycetota bacterium]